MEYIDIAVFDYNTCSVIIYQQIQIENTTEKIEDFLTEQGHKLSETHWMCGNSINVNWF